MKSSYSDIEENSPLDKIYIPGQLVFYSEADLVRMTGWRKIRAVKKYYHQIYSEEE